MLVFTVDRSLTMRGHPPLHCWGGEGEAFTPPRNICKSAARRLRLPQAARDTAAAQAMTSQSGHLSNLGFYRRGKTNSWLCHCWVHFPHNYFTLLVQQCSYSREYNRAIFLGPNEGRDFQVRELKVQSFMLLVLLRFKKIEFAPSLEVRVV